MAHLHVQVIANQVDKNDKLFPISVFNEEKDNIWNLLLASRNATPWFTGGDIIIKYGGQIYNIQLKTGQMLGPNQKRSRIGGKITTQKLLQLIEDLKNEINNGDKERIIQILYQELKTSGWVEPTNQIIGEIANSIIDDSILK